MLLILPVVASLVKHTKWKYCSSYLAT